jgi:hypothetical protein
MPYPRLARVLGLVVLLLLSSISPVTLVGDAVAATTPIIRLSASSGDIGRDVTVSFRNFPKSRSVRVTWDGTTIGTPTSSVVGDGSVKIVVPNGAKGGHTVRVVSGNASASATFTIRPQVRLSPATVTVEQVVSVSFRGYASGESISLTLDNSSKVIKTIRASSTGNASTSIKMPASPGGSHTLNGMGATGSADSATLKVVPSLALIPASGVTGANIRVHIRGYAKGERIELQWRYPDQTASLGFANASSTGSVNMTFTVPKKATPGAYSVIARGYGVSVAEVPFQVT